MRGRARPESRLTHRGPAGAPWPRGLTVVPRAHRGPAGAPWPRGLTVVPRAHRGPAGAPWSRGLTVAPRAHRGPSGAPWSRGLTVAPRAHRGPAGSAARLGRREPARRLRVQASGGLSFGEGARAPSPEGAMKRPHSRGRFSAPPHSNHSAQTCWKPFDTLNVEAVQNAAALRYQTWYVRTSPAATAPRMLIG